MTDGKFIRETGREQHLQTVAASLAGLLVIFEHNQQLPTAYRELWAKVKVALLDKFPDSETAIRAINIVLDYWLSEAEGVDSGYSVQYILSVAQQYEIADWLSQPEVTEAIQIHLDLA